MRILANATVLVLGLLASGTALANDNFGGSRLYNPQYNYGYTYPPYNYSTYPAYTNYYGGYPYYPAYGSAYGYPSYGYAGPPYSWPQSYWDPSHPYSSTNPNWIPYVGWR
jgi:hypothetical protein